MHDWMAGRCCRQMGFGVLQEVSFSRLHVRLSCWFTVAASLTDLHPVCMP